MDSFVFHKHRVSTKTGQLHNFILTFEEEAGQTRYNARVLDWNAADKEAHEKMGFHQGWGLCADQLAALVARI